MSLSAAELGSVVAELGPTWRNAQVQKVHMRGQQVALLTLRVPGKTGVLRVSVEADQAHLCMIDERGEVDRQASAFCMVLRKWLKGARLTAIEHVGGDRVVALTTSRGALRAELLGRTGRLVACDSTDRVVAFSPASPGREGLARGQPYTPPAKHRDDVSDPCRFEPDGANAAVVALYEDRPERQKADADRVMVSRSLRSLLKKQRRLITKIEGDRARAGSSQELLHKGELLKLNLGRLRKGMTSITVDDVLARDGGEATVAIALDPSLTPAENLDRLFSRARKARRTEEATAARSIDALERLRQLEALQATLDETATELDVEAVAAQLSTLGVPSSAPTKEGKKKRPRRRLPYKVYLDSKGRRILVGRSAGENDTLTLRVARPDDLWLHARGTKGSHVVVPLSRGEEVDSERLLDAATLAAHWSEARGNTTVEVTHTRRRYVQKPKGLPSGKVLLLREKVLLLSVEPDRLERLLSTHRDG